MLRRSAFNHLAILSVLFTSAGCHRVVPKSSEEQMRILRAENPGMKEDCLERIRMDGIYAMPEGLDRCFLMTPRQRWQGVWRNNFEGSIFCPPPDMACIEKPGGKKIWLNWQNAQYAVPQIPDGKLYAVEFIGRRTLLEGHYGHMGVMPHEMLVDKLISLRVVDED